jgi:aryl-alcohol dehydrogenase-like predicted oxidoreductase
MIYRRLGETSLNLSVLGYGCWGVGGGTKHYPAYGKVDPKKITRAIEKSIDLGVNFFDTSALYGGGKSEAFLSKILPKYRKKIYISTKAGLLDVDKKCFSSLHLKQSLENSLKRLNTDYIDLFQLHNFDKEDLIHCPDIQDLLLSLKKEGKIIEWGISSKTPNHALDLLRKIKFPSIQCNFNILDKRCIDNKLLKFCKDNKIGMIARTPLAFGFLSLKIDAKKIIS